MAVIPRYDEAQVAPTTLPTPRMSGASPGGEALGNLAHTLGGISREAQQQALEAKDRADYSVTMDVLNGLDGGLENLKTMALKREGRDALDNKPFYDEYTNLFNKQQSLLKNDSQRYMFARQTAHYANQFQTILERHAAEQGHDLDIKNAGARVDMGMQKLSTFYRDSQMFDNQLKMVQAQELDLLHMKGIAESDPAAVGALAKVKSDAWYTRISQMAVDPSLSAEAKHLYEVHQDEIIDVNKRDHLLDMVHTMDSTHKAIDAALGMVPKMEGGAKRSDLIKDGRELFKNDDKAFEIFEREMNKRYADYREDVTSRVGGLSSEIEQEQDKAIAAGRILGPSDLAKMPQYIALTKDPSKEARSAAHQFMKGAEGEKRAAEREAESKAREVRAERREIAARRREHERDVKLARAELTAAYKDPDILLNMSDADIREKIGKQVGAINAQGLVNEKHKMLKDDAVLNKAVIDKEILSTEMDGAGLTYEVGLKKTDTKEFKQTAKLKNRVAQLVRYEQEATGKPASPERQREIIRGQLLNVHVTNLKKWVGSSEEVHQFEADPLAFEVPGASSEEVGMVVSRYRSAGIEPTFAMVHQGVAALKSGGRVAPQQPAPRQVAAPQQPAAQRAPAKAASPARSQIDDANAKEDKRIKDAMAKESKRRAEVKAKESAERPRKEYDAIAANSYVTAIDKSGAKVRAPKKNTYMDKDGTVRLS